MKHFIYTMAVVLLASCGLRNSQNAQNEEKQNPLVEYLQQYKGKNYDAGNSIQRDELWQEREDGLLTLHSIIPSKEIPGLISLRTDWLDLLAIQGTLKSLLQVEHQMYL